MYAAGILTFTVYKVKKTKLKVRSEIDAFSLIYSLVRSVLLRQEERDNEIFFKEQTQHVSSKFQLNSIGNQSST